MEINVEDPIEKCTSEVKMCKTPTLLNVIIVVIELI